MDIDAGADKSKMQTLGRDCPPPPEVREKHSEAVHGEVGESGPAGVTSQSLNEKANGNPAREVREGVRCL